VCAGETTHLNVYILGFYGIVEHGGCDAGGKEETCIMVNMTASSR